jgi:hypothetical protein
MRINPNYTHFFCGVYLTQTAYATYAIAMIGGE